MSQAIRTGCQPGAGGGRGSAAQRVAGSFISSADLEIVHRIGAGDRPCVFPAAQAYRVQLVRFIGERAVERAVVVHRGERGGAVLGCCCGGRILGQVQVGRRQGDVPHGRRDIADEVRLLGHERSACRNAGHRAEQRAVVGDGVAEVVQLARTDLVGGVVASQEDGAVVRTAQSGVGVARAEGPAGIVHRDQRLGLPDGGEPAAEILLALETEARGITGHLVDLGARHPGARGSGIDEVVGNVRDTVYGDVAGISENGGGESQGEGEQRVKQFSLRHVQLLCD